MASKRWLIWFNPSPPNLPIRFPRQIPKVVVPSYIGNVGQVLNLLMHHGSGTRVRDYGGLGNHGNIYGGVTWRDGSYGWALAFDGVFGSYVMVPHAPSITFTTENFTLEFWANLTYNFNNCLFCKGQWNNDGWYINQGATRELQLITCQALANQITTTGNGAYADGVWFHCIIIRNGVTGYIYVNNVDVTLVQPAIVNPVTNTRSFYIMRYDVGGSDSIGIIALPRLYNRALTPAERTNHFESTRSIFEA